jgi:hypothetical protein
MSTQIEWHSDISAAPKDKRIFMIADAFIPSQVGHSPDLVVARWNKNLEYLGDSAGCWRTIERCTSKAPSIILGRRWGTPSKHSFGLESTESRAKSEGKMIPAWLVQLGSLAGLLAFCVTIWDRLMTARALIWISPGDYGKCACKAYQQMQFEKMSEAEREALQLKKLEQFNKEWKEATA